MQRETSNDSFLDYGSVYHQPIDREHPELIHQTMVALTRRYVSQFYCFNCDTYLQVKSGIGVLLVSHTAETADVQEFAMNRLIHISPASRSRKFWATTTASAPRTTVSMVSGTISSS